MEQPRWSDAQVRDALGLEPAGDAGPSFIDVSTDTRTLDPGELFVALAGENFDAHDFLDRAAEQGALGAVVERVPDGSPDGLVYYTVDDTREALGRLANHWRRRLSARVCAITGTNGKTTTKEMARAALSPGYRVHATAENRNNLVGVPLTLLEAPPDTEALVVELGTNSPGEIAALAAIVEPDAAVITSVAEGHLEGLGSLEGVLREKTSLLDALSADGRAYVGEEPPDLVERARRLAPDVRIAGWGEAADPGLRARDVRLDDEARVRFDWDDRAVRLAFRGRPNARNALLALGVARDWGVDVNEAVAALEALEPPKLRAEVHRYGGLTVVADCYNANPGSVEAALDMLVSMPRAGGRVAVVGTMNELGESSGALHRRVAGTIAGSEVDLVVATGEFADAFEPWAADMGDRLIRDADPMRAYPPMTERLRGDEVVLLKGSRSVALERLLDCFGRDWPTDGGERGESRRDGSDGNGTQRGRGAAAAPPNGE